MMVIYRGRLVPHTPHIKIPELPLQYAKLQNNEYLTKIKIGKHKQHYDQSVGQIKIGGSTLALTFGRFALHGTVKKTFLLTFFIDIMKTT